MKRNNLQGQVVALETEKLHLENEIERLNNIIKRLENEINGAYSDLSNNLNVNYMHEALKKDLLNIIKDSDK